MTIRRKPLLLAPLMLVAACGFFSRTKNQFYSLDTIPAEMPPAGIAGVPIGIDTVELPPGLDRRGIVVRGADHKIEVRGTDQWTAPLEDMVLHTLAFDLANRLPEGTVILPGQARPAGIVRSVSVVFEDLTPGPDSVFLLDARWTVSGVTHHERIPIEMPSMDSASIAAAMSRALATLADRMAAQLR
ncbi:MAG: PqiC family protein [Acidobacteriota bacterium]|nr:PqiC family protein [Acidobacteriota bacterium]